MGYGSVTARRGIAALLIAGLAAALGLALLGSGPAQGAESASPRAAGPLSASIRRDSHGIPHILANDFGGIGFGYGYAFAQDNICTIAESYVTVRAERSQYEGDGIEGTFGPDGVYPQRGNGAPANNLNSDFFYQRIIDKHIVEDLLNQPPPNGPVEEIRDGVRGYVAGYNKYLAETGVDNLPDPRCRGAAWVKPISEMDAYRRFYQLALLASQSVVLDSIGAQKTPGASGGPLGDPGDIADQLRDQLPIGAIGSNAYGLGKDATTNGKGMVLANPHFPWDGPERFYEAHLTIPGEVNVSGASLYGVPLVLIGHTDNMAWSHTVSTAYRFTPFQETLAGNPTTYLYDGVPTPMNQDQVTVQVRNSNGDLEPRTRTLYSTRHGMLFTNLLGVPLPWTPTTAFTMGDVNAGNFRYLNHFFFVNQAQSVTELDQIEKTYQGIPWVNTIAADSSGEAYYADIGAIPHVTNAKATGLCGTAVGQATFAALGLPVLDGSMSSCEWGNDGDAVAPGIFGYNKLPHLFRDDYVTNSNDSYWLSNPGQPLTGFNRIIGDEQTERSLRTRLGLRIVQQRLDGTDGQGGTKFTRQKLQDAVFNNRQYAGELMRDELVAFCENDADGTMQGSGPPVDISGACPALDNWDVHDDLDSNGAILFRRFATRLLGSPVPAGLVTDPNIWDNPFNPADPVNTPNGLNTSNPNVERALADAVTDLNNAGIPLTAPLQGYQYEKRGSEKIPIHGGPGGLGVFNAINVSWVGSGPEPGYPNIPHGSSFVMTTSFTGACPDDRSILTYSQSSNPNSPFWADQTRMFSDKQWVNPPFCEDEVLSEPGIVTTTITDSAPGTGGGSGGGGATTTLPVGSAAQPGTSVKKCKRTRKGAKSAKRCKRKRKRKK